MPDRICAPTTPPSTPLGHSILDQPATVDRCAADYQQRDPDTAAGAARDQLALTIASAQGGMR